MAAPTPAPLGRTNPPLPEGTEVWTPSVGDTVIAGSEIKPNGYVYYRCAGVPDEISGMTVYRRRAVVPAPPTDPAPPSMAAGPVAPGRRAGHAIHPDPAAPDPVRQAELRTPAFLRRARTRARERVFGDRSNHPTVTPPLFSRDHRFKDPARLIVNGYGVTEDGLSFQVTVLSDLRHVAMPHDLIPVTLEDPRGTVLDIVIVITPPPDQNVCTFSASYTWNQLAKLLGIRRPAGVPVQDAVLEVLPQAGIRAEWWDNRTGRNAPRHYSGGTGQKNGSGRIDLRTITIEDLKEAESVPETAWSVGEPLRESRPVYQAFKGLLRPGMEMATALEAESEFLVSAEQHLSVVARLRSLYLRPDLLRSLGVELMSAETIRRCTDTYYDVPGLTLLRRAVVLRRRELSSDEAGSFLLAVKGRTVTWPGAPGERIRLAAQAHLIESAPPGRLRAFLADEGADNAFARVLADGLGLRPGQVAGLEGWDELDRRLVVTAQRVRYSFELAHSTTIDFSADTSTGVDLATGRARTIHSVEFGIGHPGLFVPDVRRPRTADGADGGAAPHEAPNGAPHRPPARTAPRTAPRRVPVTRPYHVPADLDHPDLFSKRDYLQFQEARDRMMHYLFGHTATELELGGTKAHILAGRLGMI